MHKSLVCVSVNFYVYMHLCNTTQTKIGNVSGTSQDFHTYSSALNLLNEKSSVKWHTAWHAASIGLVPFSFPF